MRSQSKSDQAGPAGLLAKNYSGPLAGVALSALSAWMMVQGLKGLAGFSLTSASAAADLLGIVLIIGLARWMNRSRSAK